MVREWLCGVELYFAVCHLDPASADAKYCCQLLASLLRGNALQWYWLSCARNPSAVLTTYAELKKIFRPSLRLSMQKSSACDQLK